MSIAQAQRGACAIWAARHVHCLAPARGMSSSGRKAGGHGTCPPLAPRNGHKPTMSIARAQCGACAHGAAGHVPLLSAGQVWGLAGYTRFRVAPQPFEGQEQVRRPRRGGHDGRRQPRTRQNRDLEGPRHLGSLREVPGRPQPDRHRRKVRPSLEYRTPTGQRAHRLGPPFPRTQRPLPAGHPPLGARPEHRAAAARRGAALRPGPVLAHRRNRAPGRPSRPRGALHRPRLRLQAGTAGVPRGRPAAHARDRRRESHPGLRGGLGPGRLPEPAARAAHRAHPR